MEWIEYPWLEINTPQYNDYINKSFYLDQLKVSGWDIQISGFWYSKSERTWDGGKYYLYGALHLSDGDWIKSKTTNQESFSLLYQLANTLNWNEYKDKFLHLEAKVEDGIRFYVFSNYDNKQIIGIVSSIFQDVDEWERVNQTFKIDAYEGIVDFSLEKDNSSYLFIFKDKTKKEVVYINPDVNINGDNLEAKYTWQELNSNNKPGEDDEEFKKIAQKFNRTPEDVKKLKERYIETNREKLAGFDELKYYIRNIIPSTEKGTVIYGAFTRNSGQALIYDTKITEEPFHSTDSEEKGLFELFKSGNREIPEGNLTLRININDNEKPTQGITQNGENTENNIIQIFKDDLEKEDGFLNKYIRMLDSEDEELYLSISFEDITFGKTNFNSYVFAISANINLCNISISGFYKYLMYIKYLENERANEEKHKKAIASAIAAIMSRNMSHNLGSHFLYYSQQDFANLSGSLHDMFYEKGKPEEEVFVQKNSLESLLHPTKKSYAYTKGASKVFEFLQDRMYYLAAITGIEKSQSLPVLLKSQVLDFITDETDYRNFYLNNLVRSEQYTLESKTLSIKFDDSKDLDDVSISLPLGSISIHAIYNIFENFIRNSAKYQWAGIPKPTSLVFTIKVVENDSDIIIQIYDNKTSANCPNDKGVTLIDYMSAKLQDIRFLDDDDSLNNDNKGLKEMLLSAFWVNNRQKDKTIAEIIYDFEKSKKKDEYLKKYGLVFVADSDGVDGNLGVEFHVNKHYYVLRQDEINDKPYLTSDIVIISDAESKEYEYGREVSEDDGIEKKTAETLDKYVVEGKNEDGVGYEATKYLLSVVNKNFGENFDSQYVLCINSRSEKNYYPNVETLPKIEFTDHLSTKMRIKKDELKEEYNNYPYYDTVSGGDYTKQIDIFFKNRTQGYPFNRQYKKWIYKYKSLLIKESAITRITIVDERIFNLIQYLKLDSYTEGASIKGTSLELDFRNIQVLNLKSSVANNDYSNYTFTAPHLVGNLFRKDEINPHFISIHFGIIQQIIKNKNKLISSEVVAEVINEILSEIIITNTINSIHSEEKEIEASAYDFVTRVLLKIGCRVDIPLVNRIFQEESIVEQDIDQEKCLNVVRRVLEESNLPYKRTRVAIHTGRGSLSEQEKKALAGYPIIPFGSLRSAFLNSKFILCQLFYNLKYKK